jgi:hypothetical protein
MGFCVVSCRVVLDVDWETRKISRLFEATGIFGVVFEQIAAVAKAFYAY